MKLVKSNKAQSYHALMLALNDIISRNTEPFKVAIDYTLYRSEIGLFLKKENDSESPVVLVITGQQEGELRVTYYGHQNMVNGMYDRLGLKRAPGENSLSMEYLHEGFIPGSGFDYPKKMQELAGMIVHFFVTGVLPDEAQLHEHFSTLAKTITSSGVPKLN